MMITMKQALAPLEALEDRITPALTAIELSSFLFIRGIPEGALTITAVADNEVTISDSQTLSVTLPVPENLYIQLFRRPTPDPTGQVIVDLNSFTLTGNVILDLGRGDANPDPIENEVIFRDGTIGGDFTVLRGDGRETVRLGDLNGLGEDLAVGGNATLVTRPSPSSFFGGDNFILEPGSEIQGDLRTTFVDSVLVGGFAATARIGGDVEIRNPGPATLDVNLLGVIDGDTTVIGSDNADFFDVGGTGMSVLGGDLILNLLSSPPLGDFITFGAEATILGNVDVRTGNGDEFFEFASTVGGNVSVDFGDGADLIGFLGGDIQGNLLVRNGLGTPLFDPFGTDVAGDLTVEVSEGDEVFEFAPVASLGGSFTFRGANGVKQVDNAVIDLHDVLIDVGNGANDSLLTLDGVAVLGDLTIRVGNGGNQVTLSNNASVSGRLRFNGGNGDDSLLISTNQALLVDVSMHAGNDLVDFTSSTAGVQGLLDGGVGDDTLTQGGVTFAGIITITGFEN